MLSVINSTSQLEFHTGYFLAGLGRTSGVWVPAPSQLREEWSGNTAVLVLCQRNVVNVFTTLWTATQVAVYQYHCASANNHCTARLHNVSNPQQKSRS